MPKKLKSLFKVMFVMLLMFCSFLGGVIFVISSNDLTGTASTNGVQLGQSYPYEYNLDSDKLWMIVNDWRISEGLAEYQKSELLCDIARSRIYQVKSDWSHNGFVPTLNRIVGNQYHDIGENLAKDHISEEQTLSNWLLSPSHRQNLDANYRYSCVVTDEQYAVQIFGNF